MASEGTHATDPTRRKTQVRVAAPAFIIFTARRHSAPAERRSRLARIRPQPPRSPAKQGSQQRRSQRASFCFETFGDEQLWTDKLRLNEVLLRRTWIRRLARPRPASAVDDDCRPAFREGRSQESGHDGRAAQDECGRGSAGHGGCQQSHHAAWRHLRALSFHGRQPRS